MKVVFYMRVSTDDQTNKNQELRLQEVSSTRGWEIVGIYQDQESGAKRSRPGLDAMLSDARSGRFDAVMAVKVDRIARSLQDLLEIAAELGRNNVDLVFSDQDLDITSSQGRLMFRILGAFAEYEREIIVERTKAGLRRARREGKRIGRPGIHPMTRKRVLELYNEGMSYRVIAEKMNISRGSVGIIVQKGSPEKEGVPPIEENGVQETRVLRTERSEGF